MNCCSSSQCKGIESAFDAKYAHQELERYRKNGPNATTRRLLDQLRQRGLAGKTLLDIGGGVGALQHELLEAGMASAVNVDASPAYSQAAQEESRRRGLAGRVTYFTGNFVALADQIEPADVVTLDRVICCFDDMPSLVSLSAARARQTLGLVFPVDTPWVRGGVWLVNRWQDLIRNPFHVFAHPTGEVDALVQAAGLRKTYHHRGIFWQVILYDR